MSVHIKTVFIVSLIPKCSLYLLVFTDRLVPGGLCHGRYSSDVHNHVARAFKPILVCSDNALACIARGRFASKVEGISFDLALSFFCLPHGALSIPAFPRLSSELIDLYCT